jgi:hypothetical protein
VSTTSASNSIHEQPDGNSNGVGAAPASQLDPEFVDVPGLQTLFGIKRSLAYALLADGKIQGVSLRRRNQIRGKRLFKVDSVRAFLRSQMERGK